jgi:hypothetical protein
VPRTGQTASFGFGDDGALKKGIAWPGPRRFRDNRNGTVTDCLTSLVWVKDLTCDELKDAKIPSAALTAANDLSGVQGDQCGLTDGSLNGDWRLANVRELESLIHAGVNNPALPNTAGTGQWTSGDPFVFVTGQQSARYWTSTLYGATVDNFYWTVALGTGDLTSENDGALNYAWPVRDATAFDESVGGIGADGGVTGLTGSGLVLQNNGGDDLSITGNGDFTFGTLLARGTTYSVTVKTQPSGPAQKCTVARGWGSVPAGGVSDVLVTCTDVPVSRTAFLPAVYQLLLLDE